ncbi:MAG: hypothetical protein ACOYM3_05670 [Terrimicrobiaceae bacterium]
MRTTARKRKLQDTGGEDLWSWAERQPCPSAVIHEEPSLPAQPGWYQGILKKISGQKD